MEPVKFVALDRDDLEVVSTHLQDALVKVADVMWRPHEKRLVIALSRFDWLSAEGTKPELRRCRAALRFRRLASPTLLRKPAPPCSPPTVATLHSIS